MVVRQVALHGGLRAHLPCRLGCGSPPPGKHSAEQRITHSVDSSDLGSDAGRPVIAIVNALFGVG